MQQFDFTQGIHFDSIVTTSEQVSWTVESLFADKQFDPAKYFAPASWLGTEKLNFLNASQQHQLNHIRAFSYIHMLGNYEDFITQHFAQVVAIGKTTDPAQLRARFRFCDEEMKHQQLFARTEQEMEKACEMTFGRYFDKEKTRLNTLTNNMLSFPPIARAIILQAFEWGTQRHYLESIKENNGEAIDPLYASLLKAHWLEESQHVKTGLLEIQALAQNLSQDELNLAFEHVLAIAGLIGETFVGQVEAEIQTLKLSTEITLTPSQEQELRDALIVTMNAIWAEVAMSHPSFCQLALELSPEGAAKLGIC